MYQLVPIPIMNAVQNVNPIYPSESNSQRDLEVAQDEILAKDIKSWSKENTGDIKLNSNDYKILQPDKSKERWKREDDKRLYRFVTKYCSISGDNLDNICTRLKQNCKHENDLWRTFSNELKWKGPIDKIQKRFLMLCNLKGLSNREIELLRKLLVKAKSSASINWDSIMRYFFINYNKLFLDYFHVLPKTIIINKNRPMINKKIYEDGNKI